MWIGSLMLRVFLWFVFFCQDTILVVRYSDVYVFVVSIRLKDYSRRLFQIVWHISIAISCRFVFDMME